MEAKSTQLKRSLGLPTITFYGIGTIIGAGIYVLIGKVGAEAGTYLPYSFLLAGVIACFTALSYAELSSRIPMSAGAAIYVYRAFSSVRLSQLVGLLVASTGIISAAAIANGFVGYLGVFIELPSVWAVSALLIALTLLACWGIQESAAVITVITLIEISGLLFVIFASGQGQAVNDWSDIVVLTDIDDMSSVMVGAILAFYAFIGFEDMVNVSEEIKEPSRTLPRAILFSVILSTLLYVLVALVAARTMSIDQLSVSEAPLADMVITAGYSPAFIGLISLFAVVNGALVQMIMASRLLYGMANQNMAPSLFASVNQTTKTPIIATVFVGAVILVFALWLPITTLVKATSTIMLSIFSMVNLSLIVIKLSKQSQPQNVISFPMPFPIIALLLCLWLLSAQLF